MEEKRYSALEELERFQEMEADEFYEESAYELEREARERRARRKKRAAERRRRMRRRKRMLLMVRAGAAVLAVLAVLLVIRGVWRKVAGKPEQTDSTAVSVTSEPTAPSEVTAEAETTEVQGADPTSWTAEETLPLVTADTETAALKNWYYTAQSPAPDGDIVSTETVVYTYDQMREDLYHLKERYPDRIQVRQFGMTADNRELLDVTMGPDHADRAIIVQYSIHAREYINSLLAMKQLEEYLKRWDEPYGETTLGGMFSSLQVHIIPMLNPDGVMISEMGMDAIRDEKLREGIKAAQQSDIALGKGEPDPMGYCRTWKANARCVDLNRNFDCGWETTTGTAQPSCSRYKGTAPASENETKALVALADSINCIAQIAYHSEGELIYWDYGTDGDLNARDEALAQTISNETGYPMISTVASAQETAGCSDYFILERGVPSVTVETGSGDCPIGIEQWPKIWDENDSVLPALAALYANA